MGQLHSLTIFDGRLPILEDHRAVFLIRQSENRKVTRILLKNQGEGKPSIADFRLPIEMLSAARHQLARSELRSTTKAERRWLVAES